MTDYLSSYFPAASPATHQLQFQPGYHIPTIWFNLILTRFLCRFYSSEMMQYTITKKYACKMPHKFDDMGSCVCPVHG